MRYVLFFMLVFMSTAFAQQPDVPTLQRALTAMQAQRNSAFDALVNADIKIGQLTEENTKLKDELKALKAPTKPQGK